MLLVAELFFLWLLLWWWYHHCRTFLGRSCHCKSRYNGRLHRVDSSGIDIFDLVVRVARCCDSQATHERLVTDEDHRKAKERTKGAQRRVIDIRGCLMRCCVRGGRGVDSSGLWCVPRRCRVNK